MSFEGYYVGGKKKSFELIEREVTKEDRILVIILFTSEIGDDTIHKYVATISSILTRRTFSRPYIAPQWQMEYIILTGETDGRQTLGETDLIMRY